MPSLEFSDIDLTEKSIILSRLTSAGIAIDIVTECRNRNLKVEGLKYILRESLNTGISDIQLIFADINEILTKILKGKEVSPYQLIYAQEILSMLDFPWASGASEVLKENKYTKTNCARLENAIKQLKKNREFFNRIRKGEKQAFETVTFNRLINSLENLQRTLFRDWLEEVNTLEQSGDEPYGLLAVS